MSDKERESLILIANARNVADPNVYNAIQKENPMMAYFMLDKFKQFLSDQYFSSLERQGLLLQFLQYQDDRDLCKEVIHFLPTTNIFEDYAAIVLEWNLQGSDKLMDTTLARYDGVGLSPYSKKVHNNEQKPELLDILLNMNNVAIFGETNE